MKRMPSLVWAAPQAFRWIPNEWRLSILDCGALIVDLLLSRLQLREVLAGDVHLDCALDLLLARVLLDALDVERRLHGGRFPRRRHLQSWHFVAT